MRQRNAQSIICELQHQSHTQPFSQRQREGEYSVTTQPLWKLNIGRYWAVFHSFWISLKYHFCNGKGKL